MRGTAEPESLVLPVHASYYFHSMSSPTCVCIYYSCTPMGTKAGPNPLLGLAHRQLEDVAALGLAPSLRLLDLSFCYGLPSLQGPTAHSVIVSHPEQGPETPLPHPPR